DAAQQVQPTQLQNLRVLLLTENESTSAILSESLASFGLNPRHVGDHQTTLKALDQGTADGEPYGMILIDGDCQASSLQALLQRIHDEPRYHQTRTLLLSSAWTGVKPDHEL